MSEIAYSKDSIIDLFNDTPFTTTGSVVQNSDSLVIGTDSKVGFKYQFDTNTNAFISEGFQLQLTLYTSSSDTTYDGDDISVLIRVRYYTEVEGAYQVGKYEYNVILPYLWSERSDYIDSFDIELDSNSFIESIYLEIKNTSGQSITITSDKLLYKVSLSQAIVDTVNSYLSLMSFDVHPNGFALNYEGTEGQLRLYWNGDENDNLNGIDVNHEKLISIVQHSEPLE